MQCVILAGGLGTRIRSTVSGKVPKSMIEVCGRPFLVYQLELLKRSGVEEVVLCVGYLSDQIVDYFGNGKKFGIKISYSREEGELLGTGGAIKKAESLLKNNFLIMYGDSYLDIDYRPVFDYFLQVDCPVLMTVYRNNNRWVRSNVVFQDNYVTYFNKREQSPGMIYLDYGLAVLSRGILDEIPGGRPYNLDDLYGRLAREGRLVGYEISRRFYEIGTPEGLEELRELLITGNCC